MKRWMLGTGTAVTMALAACSSMPPPVPLMGSPADIARLEGAWSGEYHSGETQRWGSITFTLAAGADTAFGDVLMFPRQVTRAHRTDDIRMSEHAPPRTLPIRFVVTSGDQVVGMLDPYEDPECGCLLLTRFDGRLREKAIEGTYASTNTRTGELTRGTWKVTRQARLETARTASGQSR